MIWPLWPGCAFLVAVLLLTPREVWPAVLVAGLAGFAVYDVQEALPIRAIGLLLVADSIEILIAALGVMTGVVSWTPEMESMYGLTPGSFGQTQTAFENLIHPDDRTRVMDLVDCAWKTGQPTTGEWRVLWPDGSIHWIAGHWQSLMDKSGEPFRVVGASMDVTRRKEMEEALSDVSRRLIEAQERERGRIARDLHDDICQQLALVSIELEQLQRKLPDSVFEQRSQVGNLRKRIMDISTDAQTMSHELHSPKLNYLGISVTMQGFCREFGEHHKVEVEFESRDLPRQLPPDVSLCLFRVLQEALHNAAKHSGAKRFEVQLWRTPGDVHLTIADLGSGFDIEAAMKGRGLGITSMQERLKLVKGELRITSQPNSGPAVHARVPLDLGSQLAAG